MDQSTQADREMVLDNIRSSLLTLEVIKPWEKNPDNYSSGITNSAFVLMERNFAPPDERLRSLIAREKQMPAVFTAARQNLKNPPRIYTEIALEQLPGIIGFFESDVPEAFKERNRSRNQSRIQEGERAGNRSTEELRIVAEADPFAAIQWRFPLGTDTFSKKARIRRDGRYPTAEAA